MDYKLPPFFDCCLTFIGFSEEEKAHMEETTIEQGTWRVELTYNFKNIYVLRASMPTPMLR